MKTNLRLVCTFIGFYLMVVFVQPLHAQSVFWAESFDAACTNCLANGYTTGNGTWTHTIMGSEHTTPNTWYIGCDESGLFPGNCGGASCGEWAAVSTGNSLFVGSTVNYAVSPMSATTKTYWGADIQQLGTNRRIESPVINCTGKTNISISFNYMKGWMPDFADSATLWYFDGSSWSMLANLPNINSVGWDSWAFYGCGPVHWFTVPFGIQGIDLFATWEAFSITLPASANNNPNVKIGFRWKNDNSGPAGFAVAIDEIRVAGSSAWYADTDNDGWGNPSVSQQSLTKPAGYVLNNLDCNDNTVHAGIWNAVGSALSAGGAGWSAMAIDRNGAPYTAFADGTLGDKLTVRKYDGSSWATVGTPGFTSGATAYITMAINAAGTPYVAYKDASAGGKLTVKKWDGSNWVTVGSAGFSAGNIFYSSLALDLTGVPYVVYNDGASSGKATVMKYNGISWVVVGSAGFSAGAAEYTRIAFDGSTPYIAFKDFGNSQKATVMKYYGASWVNVGTAGFTAGTADYTSLAIDNAGVPYVAYSDGANSGKATVMKYNGSAWTAVGSEFSTGTASDISIAIGRDNIPFVVYADNSNGFKTTAWRFDGTNWMASAGTTVSPGTSAYPAIAMNGTSISYIAYSDGTNGGKVTVKKLAPVSLGNPGTPTIAAGSNPMYCGDQAGLQITSTNQNDAANWKWYTASCGGSLVGTGSWITANPTSTTTYYARGEGSCLASPGNCGSITITVNNRTWYQDGDGDGFGNPSVSQSACAKPAGYVLNNLDCNDNTAHTSLWNDLGSAGFSAGAVSYTNMDIDGNGTPYTVYLDGGNANKATVMKYNGSSWVLVGSAGFSAGNVAYTTIAIDGGGTPYVAYQDIANSSKATVMKYNGSNWVVVGSAGFSAGAANYLTMVIDGTGAPYVAYRDGANSGKATVMKYNGSGWVLVGSPGFSADEAIYTSLAIGVNGTPYVAYRDFANANKATVMKYNGSSWTAVGSAGFSAGATAWNSIAIDGSGTPYVMYQDQANSSKATVMKYDGSSWVVVGSAGFSASTVLEISIAIDGSGTPYVGYRDFANATKATVMRYNGSSWVAVGSAGFSAGAAEYTSVAFNGAGVGYIAYRDAGNGNRTTVKKITPQVLGNPGTPTLVASAGSIYCGDPVGLRVTSNNQNDAANWKWYTASCGGTLVGTGNAVQVSPATTTKYYARGEGSCIASPGNCDSITVTVTNRTWYQDSDGDGWGNPLATQQACTKPAGYVLNHRDCNDALVHATVWDTVSSGFGTGTAARKGIAVDSNGVPFILNGSANTVRKYVNGSWVNVGSLAGGNGLVLDTDGQPWVLGGGVSSISLIRYNGSTWTNVGTPAVNVNNASVAYSTEFTLDANNTPYIVFRDADNGNRATVIKYNGTAWTTVGNPGFSAGDISYASIALNANGQPYVTYVDAVNGSKASVMRYNGNSWVTAGSAGFSPGAASYTDISLKADTPFVVFMDIANSGKASVMKFNGSSWVYAGSPGFSPSFSQSNNIKIDRGGTPYVFYSVLLSAHKFDGSNWLGIGNSTPVIPDIMYAYMSGALSWDGAPWVYGSDNISGPAMVLTARPQRFGDPTTPTVSATATTICAGSSTTLNIQAGTLNDAGYWKWYSGSCAGTVVGMGSSISVSPTVTTTYYARGEGACVAAPGSCASVTITVKDLPNVGTSPVNKTICENGSTNFTVAATGTNIGYQWQEDAGSGFSNINNTSVYSGVLSATLTITGAPVSLNGYKYRCVVTGDCSPVATSTHGVLTVHPTPTVNTITNQSVCNGANTTTVNFTGAVGGTTYNWLNTNNTIGLLPSGAGTINAFAATNTGTTPVTATITVTPTANSCPGTAKSFDIVVKPTPTVNTIAGQTLCNGVTTTAVNFTGAVASTTYNWTNNTSSIGLAATGSGTINGFNTVNTGTTSVTGTITVTPTANGCPGTAKTFDITVKPTPSVNTVPNQTLCNNTSTAAVNFTGSVVGTSYSWTNTNTTTGLGANGTGNIASFVATNAGSSAVTSTITVTPTANSCPGSSKNFNIAVNPTSAPTPAVSINVNPGTFGCTGTNFTFTATPTGGGTTPAYQWLKDGVPVGTNSAVWNAGTGSLDGNTITCVMTSGQQCPAIAQVTSNGITMSTPAVLTSSVTITANPSGTVCAGVPVTYTATGTNGGPAATYEWKLNGVTVATGSTYANSFNAGTQVVSCIMTTSYPCSTAPTATATNTKTVNPIVSPTVTVSSSTGSGDVCQGANVTFTATPANQGTAPVYTWYKNNVVVGTNSTTYSTNALATADVITCTMLSNASCLTNSTAQGNNLVITVWPNLVNTVTITSDAPNNSHCLGLPVTFTAVASNAGPNPVYQWRKGTTVVGINSPVYTDAGLINSDQISCHVTASLPCSQPALATSNTITMTMNPLIKAEVNITVSNDSVACKGEGVLFSTHLINGGTAPLYKWYVNNSPVPGAAQHQFSSGGLYNNDVVTCEMSSSMTCAFPEMSNAISMEIIPLVKPTVKIGGYPDVNGYTFYSTVTNLGATGTYQWEKNGQDIPGATSATYTATDLLPEDKITLTIHSSMPCANPEFVSSKSMTAAQVTGIKKPETERIEVRLYPNPNNGQFTIDFGLKELQQEMGIEVVNALGQSIYKETISPKNYVQEKRLDIGHIAPGAYILSLRLQDKVVPIRFIVQ